MESRDIQYVSRFETLETTLELLLKKPPYGDAHPPLPPFQVQNIKLDFPRFNGSNVLQWIFKAKQFFSYYNTLNDHSLTITAIHLEREVVLCYQLITRTNPFHSSVAFTRSLELEFGPSLYECSRAQLFKLTQVTTVFEY